MISIGQYGWEAVAAPEYGGCLLGLKWNGESLLRTTSVLEQLSAAPEQYGIPVLVPPGRIDGGAFRFEGREYRLPINEPSRNNHLHGVALRRNWTTVEQSAAALTVAMNFAADAPEFAGFPVPFDLTLSYYCQPDGFKQVLTVANGGEAALPCAVGFHTMFCGVRRFRLDTTGMHWETPAPRYLATGRLLPDTDFAPGQWQTPAARRITGQYQAVPGTHSAWLDFAWGTVEYQVDEKFGHWCLWNGDPAAGFVAVEPYSCVSGGLNLPEYREQVGPPRLAAGEKLTFTSYFFPRLRG